MTEHGHTRLMLPGPVEVRREILEAQTEWMIGHRSAAFSELFARLQEKLKQVFRTRYRVLVVGSSGTGLWEGASRSCIRDDQRVLHLIGGAFSERWAEISTMNGKQVDVIEVEWGKAHTPDLVQDAMKRHPYSAVCAVHNETSTGVTNPIEEIGAVLSQYDDTLFMVDSVSGLLGAPIAADDWGIDVLLTSSQKAFALPPGLAFVSVSDRALERARTVTHRGYYFDFVSLDESLQKNNTPSTPPVSLMFAADKQLDDVLHEGLENRWQRHQQMRDMTIDWALESGFGLYAQEGYRSPTVTTIDNRQRGMDVKAMAAFMRERGFAMDQGYGKIKGATFRIAHMGDVQIDTLQEVLNGLDTFLARSS
jgi:predicted phosphoserine aminotransferase